MAGIIKEGEVAKALWPGVELWFKSSYDPEAAAELQKWVEQHRKPLTRWQKFKAPFKEFWYRVCICWSVLRYGDASPEIHNEY